MTILQRRGWALLLALAVTAACAERTPTRPAAPIEPGAPHAPRAAIQSVAGGVALLDDASSGVQTYMAAANRRLAAAGAPVAIRQAEISVAGGDTSFHTTVFANDRQLRLESRWVAGDPRRGGGTTLRQAQFAPLMFAASTSGFVPVSGAVSNGFATWNAVRCNKLATGQVTLPSNVFPSLMLSLGGFVNNPFLADINIVGWLPGPLFTALFGPDGANILGITFTFVWVDGSGTPTDINNDHRDDTALKEMWFSNGFAWGTSGASSLIDAETVALHEEGHALELGHFGKIFITGAGNLQISPRAVMNAIYAGVLRAPLGTDGAALCGNFASWPN